MRRKQFWQESWLNHLSHPPHLRKGKIHTRVQSGDTNSRNALMKMLSRLRWGEEGWQPRRQRANTLFSFFSIACCSTMLRFCHSLLFLARTKTLAFVCFNHCFFQHSVRHNSHVFLNISSLFKRHMCFVMLQHKFLFWKKKWDLLPTAWSVVYFSHSCHTWLEMGHGPWAMGHGSWVMGHGSWVRDTGLG